MTSRTYSTAASSRRRRPIPNVVFSHELPRVFGVESAADSGHPTTSDDGFAEGGITGLDGVSGNGSPRSSGGTCRGVADDVTSACGVRNGERH